jgi:predicted phosphoribosyltransferase
MFADRVDAGRQLAEELATYAGARATIVLGIPRGGVVVAAEVATALRLPLDIVVAAKVGAPGNPEFAIGAVTADGQLLVNPDAGFGLSGVEHAAGPAREKVAAQTRLLRGNRPRGWSADHDRRRRRACDRADRACRCPLLRRQGAAACAGRAGLGRSSARRLRSEVDEFVAVDVPLGFSAVGQFYAFFGQTEDDEVRALLAEHAPVQ